MREFLLDENDEGIGGGGGGEETINLQLEWSSQ
jgi:hypothetical protein